MSVNSHSQAGDTIVEVAIAFAVFALLAVGAAMIMNRGAASAQDSLETTLVRQKMDGQAETLRYLQQEYIVNKTSPAGVTFAELIDLAGDGATSLDEPTCTTDIPADPGRRFWLNPGKPIDSLGGLLKGSGQVRPIEEGTAPYPELDSSGATVYGMWVEAVRGDIGVGDFYDFHIRACWSSLTSDEPRIIGTIVRLYVPS